MPLPAPGGDRAPWAHPCGPSWAVLYGRPWRALTPTMATPPCHATRKLGLIPLGTIDEAGCSCRSNRPTAPSRNSWVSVKPGEQVILTSADLSRAASDGRTHRECRERALWAIGRIDHGETLLGGAVQREHLIRTYTRRLRRMSAIVPFPAGTGDLLNRLMTESSADPVIVATREWENDVVYFFCSADTTWLIGYVLSSAPVVNDA